MDKNENGPLNLYKKTILCIKLNETLQELKKQGHITPNLEKKINAKFDEIMCDEISKLQKTKNTIKGKVTSFRNCDDIWIFYCKDIHLKLEKNNNLNIPRLKIVALDEKLKKKKEEKKYPLNQVGDN